MTDLTTHDKILEQVGLYHLNNEKFQDKFNKCNNIFVLGHGGTFTLKDAGEFGTRCDIKLPLNLSDDPADTHGPLPIEASDRF